MKKIISILLSLLILLTAFPLIAVSADSAPKKLGDYESENVYYDYDKATKTLTISGTGAYTTEYDVLEGGYKFSTQYQLMSYAEEVEKVVVEEGITAIGGASFAYYKNLKTVSLPSTLKEIQPYAFYECYNLESITLPDSLEKIGFEALRSCRKLTSLNIPKNVNEIGDNFILDTPNLSALTVDDENVSFCDENNVLYNADKTKLLAVAPKQAEVTIPATVTTISDLAFALSNVKNIVIPKSVQTLGDGAFYKSKIQNITFEKGVGIKSIGTAQWYYGDEAEEYYGAFEGCKYLKKLVIPDSVVSIGFRALGGCSSLENLYIGKNTEIIGNDNFYNCKSLKKIKVNKANKNVFIKNGALYQKVKLGNKKEKQLTFVPVTKKSVKIDKSTALIGTFAFAHGSLTSVTIPKNVRFIGVGAFYNCKNLKSIKFAVTSKLKYIGYGIHYAGYHNSCYKKPALDNYATFYNCVKLKSVKFPDSMKYTNGKVFKNCKKLKTVYFGKNFDDKKSGTWHNNYFKYAFKNCNALKKVEISAKNKKYASSNGVVYNKAKTKVIYRP